MQFLKTYIYPIIIVILSIILLGATRQCSRNKEFLNEVKSYNEEFKIQKTKDGKTIASQDLQIISDKDLIKSLRDTVANMSSITTQIKVQTITQIKEVPVVINNPIYITDSLNFKYLRVPATFEKSDIWYNIKGTIGDKGFVDFDNISFTNKIGVYVGLEKRNLGQTLLLKKRKRIVSFIDQNPYTTTQKLSNFTIKERPNRFSIGIGASYGLTPKGFLPSIGITGSYNIISF